jgi:4'-phosphopantetheinyl transferase
MMLHPIPWRPDATAEDPVTALPVVRVAAPATGPDVDPLLAAALTPDENERARRYRLPADRARFITARVLVRMIAARHFRCHARDLVLAEGPHGKPFIVTPPGEPVLHFNVSHSGDVVLAAFSTAYAVGVDVERVRPGRDWDAIAARTFLPGDLETWRAVPAGDRERAFFEMWTRHEANLKARGTGIAFAATASDGPPPECVPVRLPAGYAGAVAWIPTRSPAP